MTRLADDVSTSDAPSSPTETPPEPQPAIEDHESEEGGNRLSIFIFLATLLGSLLGAAADLSDATDLMIPLLEVVNPSPRLRIAGSNTVLGSEIGLMDAWQEEFAAQKARQTHVPVLGPVERTVNISVDAVGSVEGFRMALEGQVDLLVMSEPMPLDRYQDLTDAGIEVVCAAEIGYDVIAFVTNINNDVPEVSKREMKSILSGSIDDWAEVGGPPDDIRILARHGSGTTELVLQKFTNSTEIPAHFLMLPPPCTSEKDKPDNGCSPCESNEDCLDKALNMPGSLYWVSTAWLHTQPPRYLRLIRFQYDRWIENPLLPRCTEDLLREDKPCFEPTHYETDLIRPLYMYVLGGEGVDDTSTQIAREFLAYVRGVRGQEILDNHHFYTYFAPLAGVTPHRLPGFDQLSVNDIPIICKE